jgi:hypothetical protein
VVPPMIHPPGVQAAWCQGNPDATSLLTRPRPASPLHCLGEGVACVCTRAFQGVPRRAGIHLVGGDEVTS